MPNPGTTHEKLVEAIAAVAEHGSTDAAARALNVPRTTLQGRLAAAQRAGLGHPEPARAFSLPEDLPSELPTALELIDRRSKQFARKKDAKDARHLVPVQVHLDGPVGIAFPGDPHLDDDGTDIDLIREHNRIITGTDAMTAVLMGDFANNWIGRLARLYGQQSTSAAEGWVLVEWYLTDLRDKILAAIGGNHDLWSGAGDPIQWMAKSARVLYEANGVRLGLQFPNGREIRVNGRHDFSGHSQWNTAHGPAKAAQMGWRDHILMAAHKHTSGYQVVRDPSSGLLSHCVRAGSYKTFDRYADEKGLPNQTFTVCPVCVVRPQFADDDARLIQVFFEPETAAEFLKFLRKRKSERAA